MFSLRRPYNILKMHWVSAAMAMVSFKRGETSQMRDSSVGNRADGRRSHQIFVESSIMSESMIVRTERSYSAKLENRGGIPVRGRLSNTVKR